MKISINTTKSFRAAALLSMVSSVLPGCKFPPSRARLAGDLDVPTLAVDMTVALGTAAAEVNSLTFTYNYPSTKENYVSQTLAIKLGDVTRVAVPTPQAGDQFVTLDPMVVKVDFEATATDKSFKCSAIETKLTDGKKTASCNVTASNSTPVDPGTSSKMFALPSSLSSESQKAAWAKFVEVCKKYGLDYGSTAAGLVGCYCKGPDKQIPYSLTMDSELPTFDSDLTKFETDCKSVGDGFGPLTTEMWSGCQTKDSSNDRESCRCKSDGGVGVRYDAFVQSASAVQDFQAKWNEVCVRSNQGTGE
jgi:hypothetical protein